MKRFHFRLNRVLKLKRQRERQAALAQRQAQSQVEAARIQLGIARQRLIHEATALATHVGTPQPAASRIAALQYLCQLQRLVELDESHVKKAEQRLLEANKNRARMHREVESLNLLHRARWQQYKRDLNQATQVKLDDLSMRRWQSSQTDGTSKPLSDKEFAGP